MNMIHYIIYPITTCAIIIIIVIKILVRPNNKKNNVVFRTHHKIAVTSFYLIFSSNTFQVIRVFVYELCIE